MGKDICLSCQQLLLALQAADDELGNIRAGSLRDKLAGSPANTATAVDWLSILLAAGLAFMKALQESKVMPPPAAPPGK